MLPGLRAAALLTTCLIAAGLTAPATAAPADRRPKADRYAASEDVVLVVKAPGVLKNDRLGAKVRKLSVTTKPAHGTVVLRKNGSFTYTPSPGWSGTDAFTYRVVPKKGKAATAKATVVVAAVDDPTAVGADAATTPEDTPTSGNVLANDTDSDGPLSVAAHDASNAHGTFAIQPTGAWTYTPAANFNGTASVGYTTSTGATGTLNLTVSAVDDATQVSPDAATVAEDAIATGNLLANDTDVDTALTVASHDASGAPGVVGVQPSGSWSYTPAQDFHGTATVSYTTNTGATGALTITVTPADDPTDITDDVATTPEDAPTFGNVLDNDSDVDGPLSVASHDDSDARGTFDIDSDGAWTYTPDPNWSGTATVGYTTDTGSEGVLTLTVTAVDDPTQLVADTKTVDEDNPASGNVLTNDTDPDSALAVTGFSVVGDPASYLPGDVAFIDGVGAITLDASGAYLFSPSGSWSGTVPTVTYHVGGLSSTLAISVTWVNDPPSPRADVIDVGPGLTVYNVDLGSLTAAFADPEGQAVSYHDLVSIDGGSWDDRGDGGKFRITWTGDDSVLITYRVKDTLGAMTTVTLQLNFDV